MPLNKSGSKKAVGENIATELSAGRPRNQAIAIALSTQRRAKSKALAGKIRGIKKKRDTLK